jgi:phage terminase large subunit
MQIKRVGRLYWFFHEKDGSYKKSRFKFIRGGRGSAKSWEVAGELVERAAKEKLRILCCREIQRSIKQSVHKLLVDSIERRGLNHKFVITDKAIKGVNGSEFFFEGLHHNIDSIKSIEGIDICWNEEAQMTSARSLTTLTPTIRKPDSEIWFTYNPTDDEDAVHKLADNPPEGSLIIDQHYKHNPFLPDVLKEEQEHMRKTDFDLWRHVWGGETLKRSDSEVFGGKWRTDYFTAPEDAMFYHGVDWGSSKTDPTVLVRCYIVDNTLYIDHAHYFYETDLSKFVDWFKEACPTSEHWQIKADSAGKAEIRFMYSRGYKCYSVGGKTTIETGVRWLRSFDEIVIHEELKQLILEAKMYRYKIDPKTDEVTPIIVDKHNHGWDAIRYSVSFKTQSQANYCNPRKANVYKYLMDAYTGGGGFAGIADDVSIDCYGTPDPAERLYVTRIATSVYINDFKPIIDCKVDPIFTKKEPYTEVRAGETALEDHHYLEWCENINGLSQTKEQFNQNVMRAAVRDEVCYVVMDVGPDGLPVEYMQPAITVDPTSIVTDEWSRLVQIGFIGNKDAETDVRNLWTKEELQVQESPAGDKGLINGKRVWKAVEVRPVNIGYMPVYPVFANPRVDPSDYLPAPQSKAIADICHNIYDFGSNYDWMLHKQAHDTMIFKNAEIESVSTSVDYAIKLTDPAGGTADVTAYSPDAEHPKNHLARLMSKKEELKKVANEGGVDTAESSTQAESGIAKAYTFQAKNESIQKQLNTVRSLNKWTAETYKEYYGGGDWETETIYATNFQPEMDISLGEIMEVKDEFKEAGIESGVSASLKLLASKVFDGHRDVLSEIKDEIEGRNLDTGDIDE